MAKHIALIEDDPILRENYLSALESQGYHVSLYADRKSAITAFTQSLPDLAIIDIGLGHEHDGGFMVCQYLRQLSPTVPIMFFTARDNDIDTISGLRMGADDYVTKDISLAHLLARIAALFRRTELVSGSSTEEDIILLGDLRMHVQRMHITWQGKELILTVTEFWLLHSIVSNPGHVKSRDQLMDAAKMVVDDTTITSHIKRIRKKFIEVDKDFSALETVYGMGYRWRIG
ncbi:proteobacterial dedicated sortase system response regulator [Alteromonas sp. LMIT006]|uniref:proteobacterial dedicated sortase system response regulator n=1 Tax=Alteromonadaceae TaxID=72275 RepID=UPI0020CA2765|nr:proteobacterial dedicated sortase system response regulator [Alteromonas sp. LMIT006]UTP72763.1 proteobacterial dedicated sortase system response regulator [Alteromonas sp. LMIT006]